MILKANQLVGFYMMATLAFIELITIADFPRALIKCSHFEKHLNLPKQQIPVRSQQKKYLNDV